MSCDAAVSHVGVDGVIATETLLKEAGFAVSQACWSRPSCFDFAARKNENLIFVKTQYDVDNLSVTDSTDLKNISSSFSAASLLISKNTRERPLEDDTVYSRYAVPALTLKTFENILIRRSHPLIRAGPGGYYVEIDGTAIKRKRQELGVSVGEMAKLIGVSRRTLYGYERGMAKASVSVAYKLIQALGIPVAEPMNIFRKLKAKRECPFLLTARRVLTENKFLMRIFRKSERCKVTTVKKAPFDFVITVHEEKTKIIGGVASNGEKDLDRRMDEILSVSNVVQARPIMIAGRERVSSKEIPCISSDELAKFRNADDLVTSVTEA